MYEFINYFLFTITEILLEIQVVENKKEIFMFPPSFLLQMAAAELSWQHHLDVRI